ncbi:putative zinc-binding phosphatase [Leptomonas pyrrhocoris]|uniref:Putative zinc-binding phosphatase n=1 Tax=Leptomonas pyrrhocoris TaxID=157538 RepID=A0A0M9FSL5_LEPPY|nr:putative zinc-binding phosphatase [Leptomonas pyrrhocoris]KPA75215.1 putative zinc-binding phosphatase [Leptomonas pyrrhocoris]|eukprot:XP_015653654.1 putative zinc-binding phosphatase [Leptomonas pyrrhocoris]
MSCYPSFHTLEGELLDLRICATIEAKDAVALLFYCGGDEKACVVQPCSLALSQYQLHIGPLGRDECVQLPYIAIATWGIVRAPSAVAKAFVQVQHAEEAVRGTGACNGSSATSVALPDNSSASPNTAVMPMLTPPGQQPQQPPTRPRYADPLPSLYVVTLQTKHVWQHRLIVQSDRLLKNLKAHLAMAHCLARVTDLPAFSYAEERHRHLHSAGERHREPREGSAMSSSNSSSSMSIWNTEFGWNLYSPQREFTRQLCIDASRRAPAIATEADMQDGRIGVQRDLRPWFALVDLRDEERTRDTEGRSADFFYTSSPTYPDLFLQPKVVDRELLLKDMNARSRARVPAISYVCLRTGAVLARSSQPLMRSPQLGADSDVCYTLINMGYVPHHTQPRHTHVPPTTIANSVAAAAAAKPPLAGPAPATTRATTTSSGGLTASSAAASAGPRPARPPSLFDEDDADSGGAVPTARTPAPNSTATAAVASGSGRGGGTSASAAAASQHGSPRSTAHTSSGPSHTSPAPSHASPADTAPADGPQSPAVAASAGGPRILFVADCRPQITAAGNAQLGGGYESGSFYAFCQTNFFEIDNIFGVTKAFEKLRSIVARYQGNTAEKTFLRRLYDADWLAITQRVLVCAVTAAQSLQGGVSCLVHCTDGWDRTSQCTALAMLMLDPYYRTVVGFCTLVEKEFCSFGHKFAERAGHQLPGRTSFFTHSGVASSDTETQQQQHGGAPRLDTSPVFLHFLDAVFQVHRQYPTCFEFTSDLLAYLSEVVYGCLYGTFLCNGEQERRLEGVRLRTASVWTDVLRQVQREKKGEVPLKFVNVGYDAATAWKFIAQRRRGSSRSSSKAQAENDPSAAAPRCTAPLADFVLLPNCSSKRLVFWESLYMREDADRYLSYNPYVRLPQRQQKVSWGADFDAFLDSEMAAACADREKEMFALTALEAFMTQEAGNAAVASLAAGRARSAWCVYDAVNCFNCLKAFGMWSTKTQCAACKQYFCTDCQVHDCMLQQY